MKTVITFGTFDLLHIGHINILEKAKSHGDILVVGVSSDNLNYRKKQKNPIYSQEDRLKIVASLKFVDQVFLEESLEAKPDFIKQFGAELLIMGNDWKGKFDQVSNLCQVKYLDRTPSISTTETIEKIVKN